MEIAIASGKGGTGKTTVATNLARYIANTGRNVCYADCDVEEPNGHLFLKPHWEQMSPVSVLIPEIDRSKCDYCGECASICTYNALAVLTDNVMFFPSLCHSCGGCYHICPQNAISEKPRQIGMIRSGDSGGIDTFEGRLNVGEAISPPVIKKLREQIKPRPLVIIDAPPGTSCPVIEAVRDTDYVVLVTEPTPFGLNDLILAVGMVHKLNIPHGIVINRTGIGDDRVHEYCRKNDIPVILEIPDDRRIAEAYSEGNLMVDTFSEFEIFFEQLHCSIMNPELLKKERNNVERRL